MANLEEPEGPEVNSTKFELKGQLVNAVERRCRRSFALETKRKKRRAWGSVNFAPQNSCSSWPGQGQLFGL